MKWGDDMMNVLVVIGIIAVLFFISIPFACFRLNNKCGYYDYHEEKLDE